MTIPFLCRISHRWRNLDGSKRNGHSPEKCARCGLRRDYYGTNGEGCHGLPYMPRVEPTSLQRSLSIMNEVLAEKEELAAENRRLRAALSRENGKRVHPYQRRRTSITGFGL